MKHETKLGMNRTGMDMSPVDSGELLQGSQRTVPTSAGDEGALAAIRAEYIREADPIGSVPPPGTMKGMLTTGVQMLTGNRPQVLIDKLGERAAFERGGTRLYEALITKCLAGVAGSELVDLSRLEQFHGEEARHFELVRETIESLGADPTAMTPCADVTGVATLGLIQVMNDPRTTLGQCLNAMLIAELADGAGWDMLIVLARETGHDALAERFQEALAHELEHLRQVRSWLAQLTSAEAKLMPTTA